MNKTEAINLLNKKPNKLTENEKHLIHVAFNNIKKSLFIVSENIKNNTE